MSYYSTKFGRYSVAEPPSTLAKLHFHRGQALKTVDWEPKNGVLDQEDLLAQGIRCSTFIPGAQDVDALGSCTANANTSALSNVLDQADYLFLTDAKSYDDTVALEEWAIKFYHLCTDQTGDPSQEWPPTDCGSTGLYVAQMDETMGLIKGDNVAHGGQNIVSLMQTSGLIVGQPFFQSWMEPDANGFIDGDGSTESLQAAIDSGVVGGHETYLSAVEKLALSSTGQVDMFNTVIRFRNSWTKSWGDNGSYRAHLSTYVMLGSSCDFRQLLPKTA